MKKFLKDFPWWPVITTLLGFAFCYWFFNVYLYNGLVDTICKDFSDNTYQVCKEYNLKNEKIS